MHVKDKKIEELESLLKLIDQLEPNEKYKALIKSIGRKLGYSVPPVVAVILQSKKLIDTDFSGVFLGYDALSSDELISTYSDRKNDQYFFGAFEIQADYQTKPDLGFQPYNDPNDHYEELEQITSVKHLLPLFTYQGQYIAINLKPESSGELVLLSADYSATVMAPSVSELINDRIKGLKQNVYSIDENDELVSPHNWYLSQQVRKGILEMDEYGEIIYDDASDPYRKSELKARRVFKTPLIVPISIIMVLVIYVGYTLIHISGSSVGILESFKGAAFATCVVAQLSLISLSVFNTNLLKNYFIQTPMISVQAEIEALKPIVRTNMYCALLVLFLLVVSAISTIMTIINDDWLFKGIVLLLSFASAMSFNASAQVENVIKNIEVSDSELEPELNSILQCWMNKAFPTF